MDKFIRLHFHSTHAPILVNADNIVVIEDKRKSKTDSREYTTIVLGEIKINVTETEEEIRSRINR